MAYIVTYDGDYLFDPYVTGNTIYDARISANVNSAAYFDFTITRKHDLYDIVKEREGLVRVYSDKKLLFMGEITDIQEDFYGNKEISCVDARDHLNDVLLRPYSTISGEQDIVAPSSVEGYFQWLIDQYNLGTINSKFTFEIGVNQGAGLDKDDYIYRSSDKFPTVGEALENEILDSLGGYLTLTYPNGNPTLNLYSDVHEANTQIIDFGVNLVDFTRTSATTDQYTAVRPVGGVPEKEESDSPNLIEGTRDWSNGRGDGVRTTEKYNGLTVLRHQSSSATLTDSGTWGVGRVSAKEKYTLSFWMRTDTRNVRVYSYFHPGTVKEGVSSQGNKTTASDGKILFTPATDWRRYSVTWTTLDEIKNGEGGKQGDSYIITCRLEGQPNGANVYLAGVKFEQLDHATDWSPASGDPEPPAVTIESLGDGTVNVDGDYAKKGDVVYCVPAVNRYGYKEYNWDEGETLDPLDLLEKAVADLKKKVDPKITIEVKAVDMALFMEGYDHLDCGQVARVRSKPHGIDEYLLVDSIDIDLQDPSQTTYTLGQAYDSLTGEQSSFVKSLNAGINSSLDAISGIDQTLKDHAVVIDQANGNSITALDKAQEAQEKADQAENIASEAVDKAQDSLDQAQQAHDLAEHIQSVVNGVTEDVDQIKGDMQKAQEDLTATSQKADQALEKANELTGSIEEVTTEISGLNDDFAGLQVTVNGAVENANEALQQSSQTKTDLEGFKTSVSQTYTTKQELDDAIEQEVLDRNAAIEVGLDGISATVSSNYTELTGKVDAALEAAQTTSEDLTNFTNKVADDLSDLQSQIDGSIQTWFYAGIPTLANQPANQWTDSTTRNNHLGDLYYDTSTGYAYRFMLQNESYSWGKITDSDVTKALQDAAKAQDTADNKRRVFVTTPTPPYDVGDLWVQGSGGDIKRCQTPKTSSQSYVAADWVLASKYTDDSALDDYKDVVATTYATKSSLTQTAEEIRAEVSESYQVKGDYATSDDLDDAIAQEVLDRNSAISQSATQIQQTVSQTYTTKQEASEIEDTANAANAAANAAQSDLDAYKTTVSNTYATKSSVTQTAESIKSEVAAEYTTKTEFEGLEIGGRNLLRWHDIENNGVTTSGSGTDDFTGYYWASSAMSNAVAIDVLEPSTQYTISFTVEIVDVSDAAEGVVSPYDSNTGFSFYSPSTPTSNLYARFVSFGSSKTIGETKSVSRTITTPSEIPSDYRIVMYTRMWKAGTTTDTFRFTNVKIEKGNKATDWSPAPEDMASTDYVQTTYATKSSLEQTENSITASVEAKYLSKTDASSTYATKTQLEQTEDSITTTVSQVQTIADNAYAKASQVEQTAEGIQVTLTEVEATANTANSNATTAKNNAATALNRVTLKDTRNDNQNPQWYFDNYPNQQVQEFKKCSTIGLSGVGSFCYLTTYVPWKDSSGGYPKQTAKVDSTGKEYWRSGTSATAWSAWVDAYGTATNAAKTATNYLRFDSSGLCVGNVSGTLQGNVRLYDGGIEIRNGTTVYQRLTSTRTEMFNGGKSMIAMTSDPAVRIGDLNGKNVLIDSSGVTLRSGSSYMANFTPSSIGLHGSGSSSRVDVGEAYILGSNTSRGGGSLNALGPLDLSSNGVLSLTSAANIQISTNYGSSYTNLTDWVTSRGKTGEWTWMTFASGIRIAWLVHGGWVFRANSQSYTDFTLPWTAHNTNYSVFYGLTNFTNGNQPAGFDGIHFITNNAKTTSFRADCWNSSAFSINCGVAILVLDRPWG